MYQNVTKLFTRKLGLLSPNFQVVFLINLANNVRNQTSQNGGFSHHGLQIIASLVLLADCLVG